MEVVTQKITYDICTGCGCCENICPVYAIEMQEQNEGFFYPVIDENKCVKCGKCLTTCPVYHYENKNEAEPIVYAGFANEEILKQSSSGGVFSLLAVEMLKNGGKIAGAIFDDGMHVKHTIADSLESYQGMCGSKYVQSYTGKIYREVQVYLDQGEYVLFTGCPCQVVALKNYLGKDYLNLLCVDILCHGVPSNKTFLNYLNEIKENKQVVDVAFRDKSFGWSCEHIKVFFLDESTYTGDRQTDNYVKGFLGNLFLRKSCETCVFSEFPRTGDISIGDFWGIKGIDPSMFNSMGTSMIFVNNKHGNYWFQRIKNQFAKLKELPFEPDKYHNRVNAYYRHSLKRTQYFIDAQTKSFNENVNYLLPKKGTAVHRYLPENIEEESYSLSAHDIGLVCNYNAGNFGGSLTQYALYNVLKNMGFSVYMIGHPLNAKSRAKRSTLDKIYLKMPYPEEDLAPDFKNKFEMRLLNSFCDIFVVGSDQLFQYTLYKGMGEFVTLDWVDNNKCKIAYAASFGREGIWGEKRDISKMAHFMQLFDGFSVREDAAVNICKEYFDVDAEWVLDPVFLCDKNIFTDLASRANLKWDSPFVGSYMLDPSEEKRAMIEKLMNDFHLECDVFSEFNSSPKYMQPLGSLNWHNYSVEERINTIINSDLFITDSFHGTCLSIIMKKPFISILNTKRGANRFESLLGHLGLGDRLIRNFNELEQMNDIMSIDYDPVYKILEEDIAYSKKWLKDKLSIQKNVASDSYSILCDEIYERDKKIEHLEHIIKYLSQELGYELDEITDFNKYLNILKRNQYKYIILVSVKDTSGFWFSESMSSAFRALGFGTDMHDKHHRSYIGALDGDRVVFELLSEKDEAIEEQFDIQGLSIRMTSKCLNAGNEACICINGDNYAINRRGMNFVIWDNEINAVIDKVCFDTHAKWTPCYR